MTPLHLEFVGNAFKHGVTRKEIWEVFLNRDLPCFIIRFKTTGEEKIYNALGVTEAGRYLVIGFVKQVDFTYRVIHAMNMKPSEQRRFNQSRKKR